MKNRKINAYRWLFEFTSKSCDRCAIRGCACKDTICAHVEGQAVTKGISFEKGTAPLRFLCSGGCSVPPHLRETCTIYLCEEAQQAQDFDKKTYERLKRLCQKLDWAIMVQEERL